MADGSDKVFVSARALLRERDYMVYLVTRAFGVLGTVAQSVTMGWQVYDLSRAERGVETSRPPYTKDSQGTSDRDPRHQSREENGERWSWATS